MSLNTILTTVSGIIKASHITDILSALRLQFVGRNSSGVAEAGQDLGTATYPWGDIHGTDLFVDDITLDGRPVVREKVQRSRNGIISGRTRTTSGQPDFLRIDGSTNSLTILATATPLKLVINDEIVEITSDIEYTSLSSTTYDNKLVDDSTLAGQDFTKYLGEDGTLIKLSGAGTFPDYGESVAVKNVTAGNELITGIFTNETIGATSFQAISDSFRGWFFDENGDPINRAVLNHNDNIQFYELGWVFIQNNGTTVEVVYTTPIYSYSEPSVTLGGSALADGQYWYDLDADTWKRYDGADWEILNRILIGQVVTFNSSPVYGIGTRSFDFDNEYTSENNIGLEIKNASTIGTVNSRNIISVYGKKLNHPFSQWEFTLPTDLDTGSEANSRYYAYLGDDGVKKLSLDKPHDRKDLLGFYHPFNNWRCVGYGINTAGDISNVCSELEKAIFHANVETQTVSTGYVALEFSDNITVDNKLRWDSASNYFRTNENEWYRVSVKVRHQGVVSFIGSSNDSVLRFYISLFDIINDTDDGWGIDWINDMEGQLFDTTLMDKQTVQITTIIQGKRNYAIRVMCAKENCTSVSINSNTSLSIEQINR